MPILIKPELSECSYREKLLENEKGMAFNHGIIPFGKESWSQWYSNWIEADPKERFYRFIYCGGCEDFVGVEGYYRENNRYYLLVLIEKNRRESGYGSYAFKSLAEHLKEMGVEDIYVRIYADNPYRSFLDARCFKEVGSKDEQIELVSKVEYVINGCCCKCDCEEENENEE